MLPLWIFLFALFVTLSLITVIDIRRSMRNEFERLQKVEQDLRLTQERTRIEAELALAVTELPKPRRYTPRFAEEHMDDPQVIVAAPIAPETSK